MKLNFVHNPLFYLALVLFIGVITRLLWLGSIPTTLSHDELNYVVNAVSVAKTGVGKSGLWSPLSLTPVEPSLAELPTVFIAPFTLLPFSATVNVRLLFVLIGLTIPVWTALIAYHLTQSRSLAILSFFTAMFNPWIWQNSRMTFDASLSVWLYLLGIVVFLKSRLYTKLFAIVPFILGFYCYQGMKLLLPFLAVILVIHWFYESTKPDLVKSKLFVAGVFMLTIFSVFTGYLFFQFSHQDSSQNRLSHQLLLPSSQTITNVVNSKRRLALASPFNTLFINKYIVWQDELVKRFLTVFNPINLFVEISASNSAFSVWSHGIFYVIDFILMILGVGYFLRQRDWRTTLFLASLVIIGTLPSVVNQSSWLFFRSAFTIPFLLIFIAGGLNWLLMFSRRLPFLFIMIIYFLSIIRFGFIYFVRYPIFASENIFFSPRLLVEYVNRLPKNQQVVIFEDEPEFLLSTYVVYNNLLQSTQKDTVQSMFRRQMFDQLENFKMYQCVPKNFKPNDQTIYIFDSRVDFCPQDKTSTASADNDLKTFLKSTFNQWPVYIKSVKDSGNDYAIINDKLCQPHSNLNTFVHPQQLSNFKFQTLSEVDYCRTWITRSLESS